MDDCTDASKSDSSSVEDWLDLSKSDFTNVIFSNLYWNPDCGDVECIFTLTETVQENPLDYVGLYKIGCEDLSECLVSKTLSELKLAEDAKSFHCVFKSENLPELNGFYQFLYITHDNKVCGTSMPFEVRHSKKKADFSDEEIVTEQIENDFLMVRHGLEQKNDQLETVINVCRNENSALVSKLNALKKEKDVISQELEITKQRLMLSSALDEIKSLMKDNETFSEELRLLKIKNKAVLCDFETKKKENEIITNELETVKTEKNNLIAELEVLRTDSDNLSREFEAVSKERDDLNSQIKEMKNCIFTEFKIIKGESYFRSTEQKEVDLNMVLKASRQKYEDIFDELLICKTLLAKCTAILEHEKCDISEITEELLLLPKDQQNDQLPIENGILNRMKVPKMDRYMEDVYRRMWCSNDLGPQMCWSPPKSTKEEFKGTKCKNIPIKVVSDDMAAMQTKEEFKGTNCRNVPIKVVSDDISAMQTDFRNIAESLLNSRKDQQKDQLSFENRIRNRLRLQKMDRYQEGSYRRFRCIDDTGPSMCWGPQKNNNCSYQHCASAEEIHDLIQELEDAHFMIKALENSKEFVMKEMSQVKEQLHKTKEELCRTKWENTALKVSLDDMAAKTSCAKILS